MQREELRSYLYCARSWVEESNIWKIDLCDPSYDEMYYDLTREIFPTNDPKVMNNWAMREFMGYMVSFMKSKDMENRPRYRDNIVDFPIQSNKKPHLKVVS